MREFQVLLIKEHIHNEVHKLDHRICILYDHQEGTFYYYGSRNNNTQNMYADYSGFYSYEQKSSLVDFLAFLMAEFEEVLTTELHFVGISQHEYTGLSYNKLLSKMGKQTLLAAYDGNKECRQSVSEYLNMLVQG